MIGNDIVDLVQAAKDSDWNRKGYLEKIFTPEEQFMISSDIYPDLMVWLLWSMKESAYKIHSRDTKLRSFAPAKLRCTNLIIHEGCATGNVFYEDQLYFTSSIILTDNYIHTIAATRAEDLDRIKVKISDYPGSSSDYRSTLPASVSHHGRYLALTYL